MDILKIVVAQINLLVGDIQGNGQRIIDESKRAFEEMHADVVVFPELALSSYPPEDLLFRPGFYARCKKAIENIQNKNINTTIIFGYPDKVGKKYFNKALVMTNGNIIKTYAKQDLPNYTVFDEKRYFSPGDSPCIFEVKNIKIALLICEDLWCEGPTQQAVEADAQLMVCINASPFDRNKARVRENLLRKRAIMANIPIIYGNLVGGQDELVFDGGSMVVNQQGQRVQQAKYYEEDFMLVEIKCHLVPRVITKKLPPRLSEEENIYNALTLGVHDYINKNNFPGAIVGLSGGIDSALTLAIAVDSIGSERMRAVSMPSRYTANISVEDARKEAETLGVQFDIIEIEPIFNAFLESLLPLFTGKKRDATEENIQARIRGMLLMALSNKFGSIVLTTGNKSEMSVGYTTLYGDMAGGFGVLKDIPKTMVYRLAHYRNMISPVIPQRVLERAPSAELAEGQTDQDTLPPYPILDEILYLYIEKDEDPLNIYSKHLDKKTVDKVVTMVNRNEYKRRQAPIGIRTTERAFGKDRRYPITSGYSKNI